MFNVLLVAVNRSKKTGPLDKIFKLAKYQIIPRMGDDIEYQDGWGLSSIKYIYLSLEDKYPEIGITDFNEEEVNLLLDTKEWSRELPN